MRNILLIKLILILFSWSIATFAATGVTCVPVAFKTQNKNIILPGVEQARTTQIYFLHNISQKSLWLDHPHEGSAKAGWSSFFQPGKWSAIILNRKNFALSCAIIQPGKVNFQECAKVIAVCAPKKYVFDSKRKGSYWLVEDKTWDEMISNLERRGAYVDAGRESVKGTARKSKELRPQ